MQLFGCWNVLCCVVLLSFVVIQSLLSDLIVEKIKAAGFDVALQKEQHLTKELAQQLYHEHEGKDFYEGLTDYMSR